MTMVTPMPAMAAMHEQMHERTGQQEHPWQNGDHVRLVFREEEIAGDTEKAEQDPG